MPQSRKVVISDSSVNAYGFRLLTTGAQLEAYRNNPILLYGHVRTSADKNHILPIGNVNNVAVEGDRIVGKLTFDQDDEFAKKIEKKWDNGVLRMVSAGVDPVEVSDDKSLKLQGQKLPTVTKWNLQEVSIADIGANRNALPVALFDKSHKLVTLDDKSGDQIKEILNQYKTTNMDKNEELLNELRGKLNLGADASKEAIIAKLNTLQLENSQITTLKTSQEALTTQLNEMKTSMSNQRITTLVDNAISAKKIGAGARDKYVKLATADYDTTKALLDEMPAAKSIADQINQANHSASSIILSETDQKKSWKELDKEGKLLDLKNSNFDLFKLKYKEEFKADYETVKV